MKATLHFDLLYNECDYAMDNNSLSITADAQSLIDQILTTKSEITDKETYFHTILDSIPDYYIEKYLGVDVVARVHKN